MVSLTLMLVIATIVSSIQATLPVTPYLKMIDIWLFIAMNMMVYLLVFHTFLEFPRYVTATCALFLAGKAEETPKKCRDLIKTVRGLTNDQQFGTFGQVRSNLARGDLVMSLSTSSDHFQKAMDIVTS